MFHWNTSESDWTLVCNPSSDLCSTTWNLSEFYLQLPNCPRYCLSASHACLLTHQFHSMRYCKLLSFGFDHRQIFVSLSIELWNDHILNTCQVFSLFHLREFFFENLALYHWNQSFFHQFVLKIRFFGRLIPRAGYYQAKT